MTIAEIPAVEISIHTLHTEGDPGPQSRWCTTILFQSTPSTRRVTKYNAGLKQYSSISIHTLHTEGDLKRK